MGVLPPGDPAAIRDAAQTTVFDRVHIVRYVTKVVDKNRRQEHRALEKTDRESSFTGTKRLRLNAAVSPCANAKSSSSRSPGPQGWPCLGIQNILQALRTYRAPESAERPFQRWFR